MQRYRTKSGFETIRKPIEMDFDEPQNNVGALILAGGTVYVCQCFDHLWGEMGLKVRCGTCEKDFVPIARALPNDN